MSTPNETLFSPRRVNLLMAATMLLIGAANILWAERLTINGGFGWDGVRYAEWTRDFYNAVIARGVSDYYAQRVLPSAVVHYGMRLFAVPFEDRNIILGFDVYNLGLLVVSAYVWGLIADELGVRSAGKWFGFCSLFLNFAILKNNFYHSVLTDMTAFTLGVLTFYFFLKDSPYGLLAVILLGGFSWPTVSLMSGLLFIFPYRKGEAGEAKAAPPKYRLDVLAAAAVAGLALVVCLFLTTNDFPDRVFWLGRILRMPNIPLLYVSILGVATYLFFGLKYAAADGRLFAPRRVLAALSWKRVLAFVLALTFLQLARRWLSNGEIDSWVSLHQFANYNFLSAVLDPLIFLVAHVIYYGPSIILLVLLWKPFCEDVAEFGLGFRILLIANVAFAINPQSRFMINVIPIFIMAMVRLLDRRGLSTRVVLLWALLCLLFSKVWYTFNTAPQIDDGTLEVLLRFPLQHLFMNSGSWMTTEMYYAQGGAAALAALLLYFVIVRRRAGTGGRRAAEVAA